MLRLGEAEPARPAELPLLLVVPDAPRNARRVALLLHLLLLQPARAARRDHRARLRVGGAELQHAVGDRHAALLVVARLGLHDLQAVDDGAGLLAGELGGDAELEQLLAGGVAELHDALLGERGDVHERGAALLDGLIDLGLLVGGKVGEGEDVGLGADEEERLADEERVDAAEERELLVDGVVALAAEVDEEENGGLEVGQRGDALHLDGVALLDGVVQDAGRVDHLPPDVLVVHVAQEERLRRERVGLHVHVRARHFVHEARFTHVREPAQNQRAVRWVDRGQTVHVLADFFQVAQRRVQLLHHRAHTTQSRVLQLLAAVERLRVLQQTHVVLTDLGHHILSSVDLTQSQFVVVAVVQHVD